jgi:leucyl aminopeptidase
LLADALHYSRRFKPDAVVDMATLTGACVIALGTHASGLMSNDKALARQLLKVSADCGERIWELPLFDEYYKMVESKVADVRNSSGRDAGASTAGAFLGHFIKGVPWAHLDIAGTAWRQAPLGYQPRGATGAGVRLMVELALSMGA